MTIEEWQRMPKAKDPALVEAGVVLKPSAQVVFDAVKQLCELNAFSFERLNMLLGRGNKKSVNNLFKAKIDELKELNKLGTAEFYYGALNQFICFKCGKWCERKQMQRCEKKGIELTFEEITAENMLRFEQEALLHKYSKTTIAMRMRAMRTICNIALRDGIIRQSDYCFKKDSNNLFIITIFIAIIPIIIEFENIYISVLFYFRGR